MAGKTYLQMTNLVLTNLRETTVATVSQSVISNLVGQFLNQAKEQVEDSFSWAVLNSELTFATVADQRDYLLDGTSVTPVVSSSTGRFCNERTSVNLDKNDMAMAFDLTNQIGGSVTQLRRISREDQIKYAYTAASNGRQLPDMFSYTYENALPYLRLYRNPDASRNLSAWFTIPQSELANDTDPLLVPFRPVVSLATALALEERGEELGQDSALYFNRYNMELVRAQLLDANQAEQQLVNVEA